MCEKLSSYLRDDFLRRIPKKLPTAEVYRKCGYSSSNVSTGSDEELGCSSCLRTTKGKGFEGEVSREVPTVPTFVNGYVK